MHGPGDWELPTVRNILRLGVGRSRNILVFPWRRIDTADAGIGVTSASTASSWRRASGARPAWTSPLGFARAATSGGFSRAVRAARSAWSIVATALEIHKYIPNFSRTRRQKATCRLLVNSSGLLGPLDPLNERPEYTQERFSRFLSPIAAELTSRWVVARNASGLVSGGATIRVWRFRGRRPTVSGAGWGRRPAIRRSRVGSERDLWVEKLGFLKGCGSHLLLMPSGLGGPFSDTRTFTGLLDSLLDLKIALYKRACC